MPKKTARQGLTSVQIKPKIAVLLARFTRKGMSKTEVINEALREYLIDREFQEVKNRLLPYAQTKGVYTDEDVERLLG